MFMIIDVRHIMQVLHFTCREFLHVITVIKIFFIIFGINVAEQKLSEEAFDYPVKKTGL